MKYNLNDIKKTYQELGVSKGMVIILKSDLTFLGPYDQKDQNKLLEAHFSVLADLIDLSEGTLVVYTASLSLCNTDIVFDIRNTPSEMGAFSEYIRTKKDSVRSFHPFTSWAAIGKNANYICSNTSRHSYGIATPKERLLELDAKYISIGKHPRDTTSVIHHVEMLMGVPYRYIKEFIHPVLVEGKVVKEPFYMNVRYYECNAVRTLDRLILPHFYKCGYKIQEANLGRGKIFSFMMKEFYNATVDLFKNDLYAYLESEPIVKPYRR